MTHILFSEGDQFANNLNRFMTILSTIGAISKFQLFTKKCKFLFLSIFAKTPLSLYLLIFNNILISHLKDSHYLLPSVTDPAKVDNSVGFQ